MLTVVSACCGASAHIIAGVGSQQELQRNLFGCAGQHKGRGTGGAPQADAGRQHQCRRPARVQQLPPHHRALAFLRKLEFWLSAAVVQLSARMAGISGSTPSELLIIHAAAACPSEVMGACIDTGAWRRPQDVGLLCVRPDAEADQDAVGDAVVPGARPVGGPQVQVQCALVKLRSGLTCPHGVPMAAVGPV